VGVAAVLCQRGPWPVEGELSVPPCVHEVLAPTAMLDLRLDHGVGAGTGMRAYVMHYTPLAERMDHLVKVGRQAPRVTPPLRPGG
jgi:hypothetical protein